MTPQERQLIDSLFERLARLEAAPRDADAERAIADGLSHAPNAVYALTQTVLVQDEALKRADQRIRELTGEDEPAPQGGGFLDSMREAVFGRSGTSVPSVRSGAPNEPDPRWNRSGTSSASGAYANDPYANAPPQGSPVQSGGSSFLGNAAASAVGAIGGALLFNSISSMFGGHRSSGSAFGDAASGGFGSGAPSPWDKSAAGSDLARDAGLNDIGRGTGGDDARQAGFLDDSDQTDIADAGPDFGNDFSGDFGGDDSDSA